MKRSLLTTSVACSFVLSMFAMASCSLDEDPGTGTAGTTGVGGATAGSSTTAGSGGAPSTAGMTGSAAGSVATAGAGGSTAGASSTGGTPGTAGAAGAGGSTAGTGGGGAITVDEFAGTKNNFGFAWKDSWFITGCVSKQAWDCAPVPNCDVANGGHLVEEEFQLGGTVGKTYEVTIKVNGITEGKEYRNGMRRRATDDDMLNPGGGDGLYIGGEAKPGNYNAIEVAIYQPGGMTKVQSYFLNSGVPGSEFTEHHRTIAIGYEFKADVPGGGVVKYTTVDSNCKTINNCGPDELTGDGCPSPRNVPNEPGLVVPTMYAGVSVASLNPVNGAAQPFHAQIIHVTVTNVVEKP